ncbi:hypothetical protein [Legionella brunensis]|uniref:Uncharacterized protein n=1 Tax=Legionella brunensis TaxID=29422 RepID=A0A0W0SHZ1_9GAMM|nr:hypothetical protein [Legionella brunensis]KTC82817.1 hypothetical protein Lbru_1737 [Legionella brunensis]
MRKGLKKIDIIDRRNTPVLTSNFDGITSAYREYLEAKKIIITHGKISVGISTTLANNFQLFTQALFKINDQEFLIEREGMITLGNCLNPNHQSTLKALVNNESKLVGNNERAEQFWLTTEDRQYYS